MKKRYMILVALLSCALALPVILQAEDKDRVISVLEALEFENGAKVVLEGLIAVDMGGDLYLFRDNTGEITLRIDMETWGKQKMDPGELVRVYGEIYRKDELIEIDVIKIKFIKDLDMDDGKIEDNVDEYLDDEFQE